MNLRPKNLSEIVGCDINKRLLLAVAKNGGCSTFIFSGEYGCGKTTMARCFGKMCNCENLTDDLCGNCASCKSDYNSNPCYMELDSSLIGNVEAIDNLYEDLTFVPKDKKKVVVLDEFHLTSKQAQSKMLKLFEDAPKNIYYILCTTDKNAILPTIISRSLVLNFNTISKDEVASNIKKIALNQNINISDEAVNLISLRSKGHMRDAHKLYEKCVLIGESDFLNLEESSYTYLAKYFAQVMWLIKNARASSEEVKKHKDIMIELVNRIIKVPISLVKDDYQNLILDLVKKSFDQDYKVEPIIEAIVRQFDIRSIMNLYKVASDEFTMNSFDSDIRFQAALLSIYQRLLIGF